MTVLIIILTGLFLLCANIYAPWGLSAGLGLVFFIVNVGLIYHYFGLIPAIISFFALLTIVCIVIKVMFKILKEISSDATSHLTGKGGVALTDLCPTGYILVENRRYQAIARERWIKKGSQVMVVGAQEGHLIVKPHVLYLGKGEPS
jgi:membrane-bound serine protease (ClpP class)